MKEGSIRNRKLKMWRVLPRLALKGMTKNGAVYYPYIGAGIFSVFTYFVFSSILHNDIIQILPKSMYAWMMLQVGRVLLGLILLPFLFYTNSFLIKQRKKEIGLYSILGLEKKHIGIMLLTETVFCWIIVLAAGIISGTVFAKLLFLLLLRMTGLPLDVSFTFYPAAFAETAGFFLCVYGVNLTANLIQVGKSRPAELLSGGKKGEKEPRFLWLYALLGAAVLGWGYWVAVTSVVDSMIYTNFFLSVFLIVVGTYLLFTSGSVALLKVLKRRKRIYYRPSNFITISGMLYRMKKNAASLVNICVFSTMVIITLICTTSLYLGMEESSRFSYPYDADLYFSREQAENDKVVGKIEELEAKYGLRETDRAVYDRIGLSCKREGNSFTIEGKDWPEAKNNYKVNLLLLADYNRMENRKAELASDEALVFSSGADFACDSVNFMGKELRVKEEPEHMRIAPKAEKNVFQCEYFLIVKDRAVYDELVTAWAAQNEVEDIPGFVNSDYRVFRVSAKGEETNRKTFVEELTIWCQGQPGYISHENNLEGREQNTALNGGLLFIGILFSLVFLMCLLLIMYYKQISEGYEDQGSFSIMRKVGMSGREIKGTVRRQILLVFFLPLAGALLHTVAGLFMVNQLFATLNFFNTGLIVSCAVGVTVVFTGIYGLSYLITSKTYYGIVSRG